MKKEKITKKQEEIKQEDVKQDEKQKYLFF